MLPITPELNRKNWFTIIFEIFNYKIVNIFKYFLNIYKIYASLYYEFYRYLKSFEKSTPPTCRFCCRSLL